MFVAFVIVVAWGYLLGSIPNGFLAGKACGVDLRKEGSGNIGATNALRTLGKPVGYAVFAADFLKGFAAVLSATLLCRKYGVADSMSTVLLIVAAAAAVCGHIFPIWLGFKGGKGIATACGSIAGISLWVVLVFAVVWVVVFYASRYVSLASICASVSLPITATVLAIVGQADWVLCVATFAFAGLAVWSHRSNISRLMAGTELRFEKKKKG